LYIFLITPDVPLADKVTVKAPEQLTYSGDELVIVAVVVIAVMSKR